MKWTKCSQTKFHKFNNLWKSNTNCQLEQLPIPAILKLEYGYSGTSVIQTFVYLKLIFFFPKVKCPWINIQTSIDLELFSRLSTPVLHSDYDMHVLPSHSVRYPISINQFGTIPYRLDTTINPEIRIDGRILTRQGLNGGSNRRQATSFQSTVLKNGCIRTGSPSEMPLPKRWTTCLCWTDKIKLFKCVP